MLNLATVQEAVAAAVPDRPAIVSAEASLTYAEFTERTRRLANALVERGAPPPVPRGVLPAWETGQGHVAVLSRNRPEYLEAVYGALKARLVPFNVNTRYTAAEMAPLLAEARPHFLVFESRFAPVVAEATATRPGACGLLQMRDGAGGPLLPGAEWYDEVLTAAPCHRPALDWSADDAYLLYTGGTTGPPRGVIWRQADIWAAAVHGQRHARSSDPTGELRAVVDGAVAMPPAVMLPLPPYMHGAAQWLAMAALHGGDTVAVQEVVDRLDPADVWRTVERHRVQALLIVGDAFGRPLLTELARRDYDTSSLRVVVTGGAATSEHVKAGLAGAVPGLVVADVAGSSESGRLLTVATGAGGGATGVFHPSPDTVVLDPGRRHVLEPDDGRPGWLGRTGPTPLGYLHDPAKTAATFVTVDGRRVAVTGDHARWRPDGTVELLGREAAVINTGGEKVHGEEVERALLSHPAVADALVVGRPSERWGQEVVALVVFAPDAEATDDAVVGHVRHVLAGYKVPKVFVRVPVIERSPAGKPDYAWGRRVAAAGTPVPR